MRYREDGQVHLDFHRTTNGTISYLRKTYGDAFLDETFRRTARDVYRSIREDLERGDATQLLEHWKHFFGREGGEFEISEETDEIRLEVKRCPAVSYLRSKSIEIDPAFCRQTSVINDALVADSEFEIETEVSGDGQCVQTLRRRRQA